jgi:hypothetical protein
MEVALAATIAMSALAMSIWAEPQERTEELD